MGTPRLGQDPFVAPSPYEAAFGAHLTGLHPRLRPYFAAIPTGSAGYGTGVFSRVGSPRRWLWPLLAVLGRQGVVFPAWARDVPFTVVNRPIRTPSGAVAVSAVRTFFLPQGERRMVDAIAATRNGLVDQLGPSRRYAARLEARITDGALQLHSTAVSIRVGRRSIRLPAALAPRVRLIERFDELEGRQHVAVVLEAPLLGRLYEYSGWFDYEIRPDQGDR